MERSKGEFQCFLFIYRNLEIRTKKYITALVIKPAQNLLQRDESGRVVRTNSRSAVSDRSVSNGELTQIVTNHISSDVHNVEHLSVVHGNGGANHLRDNDHVSEVGLDNSRPLIGAGGYKEKKKR